MAAKRNPGGVGAPRGTDRHLLAVSGEAYHQKKQTRNAAIFETCRKAAVADAARKAVADAKLKAASMRLGMAPHHIEILVLRQCGASDEWLVTLDHGGETIFLAVRTCELKSSHRFWIAVIERCLHILPRIRDAEWRALIEAAIGGES